MDYSRERTLNVPAAANDRTRSPHPSNVDEFSEIAYDELRLDIDNPRTYNSDAIRGVYEKGQRKATYWTQKISYVLARYKSRVMTFAMKLRALLHIPLSDVIHEFPRDYLTPLEAGNKTIKDVLEGLLQNLPEAQDTREWHIKQVMIRSIIHAVKEYQSYTLDKKGSQFQGHSKKRKRAAPGHVGSRIGQMPGVLSENLSHDIEDDEYPEQNESPLAISTRLLSIVNMEAPNTDSNKGHSLKLSVQTLNTVLFAMDTILTEDNMISDNGAIPLVEEYQPFTKSLYTYIKAMNKLTQIDALEQITSFVQVIMEDTVQLSSKTAEAFAPSEAPTRPIMPVKILIHFTDMIRYIITSLYNQVIIDTAYTFAGAPDDKMINFISDIIKTLKSKFSMERFTEIMQAYIKEKANSGYRLTFSKNVNASGDSGINNTDPSLMSDIAQLLTYLNELGSSLEMDPKIQEAWQFNEEGIALIFFTDDIYGYLRLALGRIQGIEGKTKITLMDLMTANEEISTKFAHTVKLEYDMSSANVRERIGPANARKFLFDVTRYQHLSDQSNVRGCLKFFSKVYRVEQIQVKRDAKGKKKKVVSTRLEILKEPPHKKRRLY